MARPYQPVQNTAQCTMELTCDNQKIMQTFYFKRDAGWEDVTLNQLSTAALTWWTATASDFFTSDTLLNRIVSTDLTSLDGARDVVAVSPGVPGAIVGDFAPLNVTLAIHLDIGNRGRGRNGRTFWPALPDAKVIKDSVDSIFASDILGAIDTFKETIRTDLEAEMVIVHRKEGDNYLPAGIPKPVMSISTRDLSVDSQVDRLPYHKRHKKKKVPTP